MLFFSVYCSYCYLDVCLIISLWEKERSHFFIGYLLLYLYVVFSLCKELNCFTLENVIELEFNSHIMYVFFHGHVASSLVIFRLKKISNYIIVSIFKNPDLLSVRPHPQRVSFCVRFSLASTQKQFLESLNVFFKTGF